MRLSETGRIFVRYFGTGAPRVTILYYAYIEKTCLKKSYRLKSQCSMARALIGEKLQVVQSIAIGMEIVPSRRSM